MSNPYEPQQPGWPASEQPASGQPASQQPASTPVPPPDSYPPAPPTLPPPGWYPDPAVAGGQRYWDGAQWTAHAQPPPPVYAPGSYATGYAPTQYGVAAYAGAPGGYAGAPLTRTGVTFAEAIGLAFTRWSDYRGRSSRSEFWWFQLVAILFFLAVGFMIGLAFPGHLSASGAYVQSQTASNLTLLLELVSIPIMLPLQIRRLHDTGRPWPYLLLGLIPCVGFIVLIVFYCQDTQPVANQWGPPPK